MKKIPLTQGKFALVDDGDFEWLNQWKWCYDRYAVRSIQKSKNQRMLWFMHWSIIGKPPKGLETDHINGDKLDNRKNNLRIVTRSQNMMNKKRQKNNTSGFKGVSRSKEKKKWYARICYQGKEYFIGSFNNEKEAAKAYNIKAKEYFGTFALFNKIHI